MIRRPPRSTLSSSSAASDVYKRQLHAQVVARGEATSRLCVPEAATQQASGARTCVLVEEHAEVHLAQHRVRQPGNMGLGVANDHECSGEPAVVHAGEEGVDGGLVLGPHGDHVT